MSDFSIEQHTNSAKMEPLLEEQSFDIDKLVQQISNYGKDGKSRKTKGYLDARLLTMDEYWNAINNRHTKLEPFGIDDPGKMQPYFVERTFDKTKASYQIVRTDIIKRLAALGHEPETTNLMESESSDEDEHTEVTIQSKKSLLQPLNLRNRNQFYHKTSLKPIVSKHL